MIVMLVCLFLFPLLFSLSLSAVSLKAILARTGAGSKIEEGPLNVGELFIALRLTSASATLWSA